MFPNVYFFQGSGGLLPLTLANKTSLRMMSEKSLRRSVSPVTVCKKGRGPLPPRATPRAHHGHTAGTPGQTKEQKKQQKNKTCSGPDRSSEANLPSPSCPLSRPMNISRSGDPNPNASTFGDILRRSENTSKMFQQMSKNTLGLAPEYFCTLLARYWT